METNATETKLSGVKYFPLDVTTMTKGMVFNHDELEKIMRMDRTSPMWHVGLLRLQRQIQVARNRLSLPLLTMRTHRGTLIVCDDADASSYNRAMGKRGIRRFIRSSARNLAVDVTKLTAEQAAAHDRTIQRQAMLLSAIRSHRLQKPPESPATQRMTPRMLTEPPIGTH